MKHGLADGHISKDDVCWVASGPLHLDVAVADLRHLQQTFTELTMYASRQTGRT